VLKLIENYFFSCFLKKIYAYYTSENVLNEHLDHNYIYALLYVYTCLYDEVRFEHFAK
jgi:hypothetical protein